MHGNAIFRQIQRQRLGQPDAAELRRAVAGVVLSLALDLAEYGITVHSLMLGNLLKSPMFQSLLPQYATKLGIDESEVELI